MTRQRLRLACAIAATAALTACPSRSSSPGGPQAVDDRAARIRVAQAEARRGAGITELVELATTGDAHVRAIAIRGLGRSGGPVAVKTLRALLTDRDPALAAAAAGALGLAAQLDESESAADVTAELVATLARVPAEHKPLVIEAIGRAGDPSGQQALLPLLAERPELAVPAALAFARYGRRKLELDPSARIALIGLAGTDAARSYAAVYALARAHLPPSPSSASAAAATQRLAPALIARLSDDVPEIRAQAVAALARHDLVRTAGRQLESLLLDRDWRVAVEAVRALTGDKADDAQRDAVATALVRRFGELVQGTTTEAHVVIEGLRLLAPHARRPLVTSAASAIATGVTTADKLDPLTSGWIGCLASAVTIRAAEQPDLSWVNRCELPDHLRLPLIAKLVEDGVGTEAVRRTVLVPMLSHGDARVKAAALPALVALAKDSATVRDTVPTVLAGAVASNDAMIAGTAVEAAGALGDLVADRSALDAAVIARAASETDPELAAALYDLIGKRALAAGVEACRAGTARHAVVAKAARGCLRALGETVEDAPLASVEPPPVDVSSVIGTRVLWTLETTRGPITIALLPEVAPWAVASIVALTKRGFYDDLEVHRVVPGFVVQGGDPTQSGWGGPGYMLPAEPSTLRDGEGFVTGGVGVADAGRDSGGSQWFVMHGRAAHLDGRYTWIGQVRTGQKSADALQIGDKVTRAAVVIDPK